jgi:acetolactate synthase-1/2/3 large subunit
MGEWQRPMDGGRLAARTLRALGADAVFTLCGGHVMPLYTACPAEGIRVVDVRHEQAAVHAAEAWGRVMRRPGVAVVTAGPGVTGSVTGVANAYAAASPLVLVGGARPLVQDGQGALQELPQADLLAPITKWRGVCREPERIGEYLMTAWRQAWSQPRGPVYVELPMDVLFAPVDDDVAGEPVRGGVTTARAFGDPGQVMQAVALLNEAERPVVIAGSGVYWDEGETALHIAAERANLPVFTNGLGRGALEPEHPLAFALARRTALADADVVLVVGAALDFRLGFGRPPTWRDDTKLVHVHPDPAEIGRNREPQAGIAGDCGAVLGVIADALRSSGIRSRSSWIDRLRAAEDEAEAALHAQAAASTAPVGHYRLAAELAEVLPEGAYVIGDGGDVVAAASRLIRPRRAGRWLDPGPLGCLGVGLPYAIGVGAARPEAAICVIQGDGAFGLNGMEFETLTRIGLPALVVIGNDAAWGEIRNPQRAMYPEAGDVATVLAPSRYDRLVEAFGGHGEHVDDTAGLRPALERALASGLPAIVDVALDREAMAGHPYRGM